MKTPTSQKRRAVLTARKLLQEKAIAIENDIHRLLRQFRPERRAGWEGQFEEWIDDLVEDRPDLFRNHAAFADRAYAARRVHQAAQEDFGIWHATMKSAAC
ncbi:hypothetical protein [Mesorhizobium cantuariense]|uniref:Uncharacterized protein n=1 Tax=Mesorhizobium cantuariense TaxID=1300275 RepID=A0ABV7MWS5_9HYPH